MHHSAKARTFVLGSTLALLVVASAPAFAQGSHDHDAMAGMHHPATAPTPAARAEIAKVEKAVAPLGTTASARQSGFSPVFGWIPTMGEHWVNRGGLRAGSPSDPLTPNNLMFSRIDGRDSLVGAAYAYYAPQSDSLRPKLFDGAPAWHEHANLAPTGQTLVMLHVWFVPSPDGPFAGTNPNLPFWALGLDAPDAARMSDAAYASRIRRAALALGEVADTTAMFPTLERRPAVHAATNALRDSVRALIPQLKAAQSSKNAIEIDRAMDRIASQWDAMYSIFTKSTITADGRRRVDDYVAMLMSDHGHH